MEQNIVAASGKGKKTSPLNYIFAVGKIRAIEKFLIRQEVLEEAMRSDLEEALKIFAESAFYGDELLHIKESQQLEEVLAKEELALTRMIRDLILDNELFNLLKLDTIKCAGAILKVYNKGFLGDYIRHIIDMHNIKTFLRLRMLKEPEDILKKSLVCEGFIKRNDFMKLYDAEIGLFMNRLEYVHKDDGMVDYSYFLREAVEKLQRQGSFVALEKAINDFLINMLKPAKYLSFGPEPVIAYYFARRNEINLMRMIIMAKLNNISEELVKERLNAVYA